MQKNNVVSLVLIVVSAVLMFSWSFIADLFGGMSRPYVPSMVGILVLLSAVLLYFGIRKSTIDFRGNISVVLIFFFSGILGPKCVLFHSSYVLHISSLRLQTFHLKIGCRL